MRGQWFGTFTSTNTTKNITNSGRVMINIDELDTHYEIVAYINPNGVNTIKSVAYISTDNKQNRQNTKAYVNAVDPRNGFQTKWEDIQHLFPEGTTFSTEADVEINLKAKHLNIHAITNNGFIFNSTSKISQISSKSKIKKKVMTWSSFKIKISKYLTKNYIFRGQEKPWSLCTSFHRNGRYRINEFVNKDVKELHQKLSAITSHYFNLSIPDQNGAFFSLLQHHGYPTPLLDWSYSPFVAAFFAFRNIEKGYSGDTFVRIYLFNFAEWNKKCPPILLLDPCFPHLSVTDFIALNNQRLVPQQAVTTASNIADIESYILQMEKAMNTKFIEAIDIKASERDIVMQELRYMGITAGSMFPTIDGICEDLRERNF